MVFSYYGSKSKIWKKYPAPRYKTIIEPFAGAANYALGHHAVADQVILIEKNPKIVAIWRWLQIASEDDIRRFPITEPGTPIPDVQPPEAKWFLGLMLNQGSHSPKNFVGGFKGVQKLNWERVITDVRKIRSWVILEGDYTSAPDMEATWYIDPPYQGQKLYPFGRDLNYTKLAEWCKSRKGQVIVAENDTADWLPFQPLCVQPGQRQGSKLRNEGIWTNEAACEKAAENVLRAVSRAK